MISLSPRGLSRDARKLLSDEEPADAFWRGIRAERKRFVETNAELLAALRFIESCDRQAVGQIDIALIARTAIAKAKGK